MEGSLFLVKRRSQPRFQFIILNKKSAGVWWGCPAGCEQVAAWGMLQLVARTCTDRRHPLLPSVRLHAVC